MHHHHDHTVHREPQVGTWNSNPTVVPMLESKHVLYTPNISGVDWTNRSYDIDQSRFSLGCVQSLRKTMEELVKTAIGFSKRLPKCAMNLWFSHVEGCASVAQGYPRLAKQPMRTVGGPVVCHLPLPLEAQQMQKCRKVLCFSR